MKKIFIFMLLCCCCISINAQDCSADITAKADSTQQVFVSNFFDSEVYKSMLIMALESDYDVIYKELPPSMIIASRGDKYYKVEIFTGEETEIDRQHVEDAGRYTDSLHVSQSQESDKKDCETDD